MLEQQEASQIEQYKLSLKLLEQRTSLSPGHQLVFACARGDVPPTPELKKQLKRTWRGEVTDRTYLELKGNSYGNTIGTQEGWPQEVQVTDDEIEAMQWAIHSMNEKVLAYGQSILDDDPDIQALFNFMQTAGNLLTKEKPKKNYTTAHVEAAGIMTTKYAGLDWSREQMLQRQHNAITLHKMDEEDIFRKDKISLEAVQRLYETMRLMDIHFYKARLRKLYANGVPINFSTDEPDTNKRSNFILKPTGFIEDNTQNVIDTAIAVSDSIIDQIVFDPDNGMVIRTTHPQTGDPLVIHESTNPDYSEAWHKPGEPYADYCKRVQTISAFGEIDRRFRRFVGDTETILETGQVDQYELMTLLQDMAGLPGTFAQKSVVYNMLLSESTDLRNHMEAGKLVFNTLFFRSLEDATPFEFKNEPKGIRTLFTALFNLDGAGGGGTGLASAMDVWKTTAIPIALAASGANQMGAMAEVMVDQVRTLFKPYIMIQGNPLRHGSYLSSISEVSTFPLDKQDLPFAPYQFPEQSDQTITLRTVADPTSNMINGVLPLYTNEYAAVSNIDIICGGEPLVLHEDFVLEYEKETGHYRVLFNPSGKAKIGEHGIDSYNLSINPNQLAADATPLEQFVPIENLEAVEEYAHILEERGDTQIAVKMRKAVKKARDRGVPLKSSDLEAAFIAGARYGFTRNSVKDYYREVDGHITPAPDVDGTTVAQCSHAANLFTECIQYCLPEAKVAATSHLATFNMPFGFIFAGMPHADVRGEVDGKRFRHDPTPKPTLESYKELLPKTEKKKKTEDQAARNERQQNGAPVSRTVEQTISLELAVNRMKKLLADYDGQIEPLIPRTTQGGLDVSRFPRTMVEWRATLEDINSRLPGLYLQPEHRSEAQARLDKLKEDIEIFGRAAANDKDLRQRDQVVKIFGPYSTILWELRQKVEECGGILAQM